MFVRTKKNNSGTVSVQVIDKSTGAYKVIKSLGSSKDEREIEKLIEDAREYIMNFQGQQTLLFTQKDDK